MIKKALVIAFIGFLFTACNYFGEQKSEQANYEITTITVEDFTTNPDKFVGQEICIEGTTVHVCEHGGKRMFIVGEDPDDRVKIEAGDGIPSFAVELEGSNVSVTGIVDVLTVDEAYLDEWEKEIKASNKESELKIHEGKEGHEHQEDAEAEMGKINNMREQLKTSGEDQLYFYSIKANSYKEIK